MSQVDDAIKKAIKKAVDDATLEMRQEVVTARKAIANEMEVLRKNISQLEKEIEKLKKK